MAFEPLFAVANHLSKFIARALKYNVIITGEENIPRKGGALLCINHTGYVDFYFAAMPLLAAKRQPHFMAKQEIFENPIAGPLMRALGQIPVDRIAGRDSMNMAIDKLKNGEIVGIFPEGTMSDSFEIKSLKTGAVRMAQAAGVKIYPVIVWGSHRVWRRNTKPNLERNLPFMVHYCEPIDVAGGDVDELTEQLHTVLKDTLEDVRNRYFEEFGPFEPGLPWVPARFGGSAPTLEEAQADDDRIDKHRKYANSVMRHSAKAAKEVHSVILNTKDATLDEADPEAKLSRLTSMREAAESLTKAAEELVEAAEQGGEEVKRKAGAGSLRYMTETVASATVELEQATVRSARKASRKLGAGTDSVTEFATGFRHRAAKSLQSGAEYLSQKAESLLAYLSDAEETVRKSSEERHIRHAIAREKRMEQAAADEIRTAIQKEEAAVKHAERETSRALENAARATEEVIRVFDDTATDDAELDDADLDDANELGNAEPNAEPNPELNGDDA